MTFNACTWAAEMLCSAMGDQQTLMRSRLTSLRLMSATARTASTHIFAMSCLHLPTLQRQAHGWHHVAEHIGAQAEQPDNWMCWPCHSVLSHLTFFCCTLVNELDVDGLRCLTTEADEHV